MQNTSVRTRGPAQAAVLPACPGPAVMTAPLRLTFGGYQGPGSVHTRGLSLLRDALQRHAGGAIDVEIRANLGEDGHKTADLPALAESGEIDLCYVASSYLSRRAPALSLFDMPFAAPDRDGAMQLLGGALGQRFAQEIETNTGLALLGVWDNGLRHIATAGRALRDPSDSKDLVLRILPNDDHRKIFGALGFEPRVIDATDLHDAVRSGAVDAQENPLTNTLNFGLHQALPAITLTGHLMGIALLLINRSRLAALPQDLRQAVLRAADEATAAQHALAQAEEALCKRSLTEAGARFFELTPAQRAAWRAAAEPEVARCRARLDPELLTLFDTGIHSERKAPA